MEILPDTNVFNANFPADRLTPFTNELKAKGFIPTEFFRNLGFSCQVFTSPEGLMAIILQDRMGVLVEVEEAIGPIMRDNMG